MAARQPARPKPKPKAAGASRAKSASSSSAAPAPPAEDSIDTEIPVVEFELEPEVLEDEVLEAHLGDEVASGGGDEFEVLADSNDAPVPVLPDHSALAAVDSLSRYLSEIRSYPVLSREEEHEIALRYFHDGDADAAVRLVTANLRLVVIVAREYQRAFHNLLDLIQEGNVGLLEAVKQFDPYRGVRFPSYAVWWIRAYVIRYVMNNFRLVKVGTTQAQRRLFFNLKKEKARLEALGFTPSAREIAENLGVKEKEVIEMDQRLATSSEVSVETPLGNDGGGGTVLDLLPAPGHSAEDDVSEGEFYALMKEKIEEFGSGLKGREAEIYRERLVAEEPLTLQELGDRYGVSRERVRQMEVAVKKKLREYLVSQVRDLDEDMVR
ncbi:MAG: RNA polymerase factor sigma-32 [Candidatus Binatia bacterium]